MNNKALIYDDNCPLCVWYSDQFVQTGMLANRIAFTDLNPDLTQQIDPIRSKHEIPLVDLEGGKTIYGLDSLVHILAERLPLLGRIMAIEWVYRFFKVFYKLVSYNRRVIVAKKGGHKPLPFDCTPDFNVFYRSLYIAIALVLAVGCFMVFGNLMSIGLGRILGIGILVGIGLPGGVHHVVHRDLKKSMAYIGQWSTIVLIGGLLLVPVMVLFALFGQLAFVLLPLGLVLSLGVMVREYGRRMVYLKKVSPKNIVAS